jgi:SAM-dependent methyltransferase
MVRRCKHFGFARECPCCGARVRSFQPFGLVKRLEAQCPVCKCLERHRLIYLYFTQRTDLFDGHLKRMLHVAPEPQLARLFQRARYIDYLTADLSSPRAMVKMDIARIEYPAGIFDVIYCSHVLEHVPNDRQAMRELYRVLKLDGWAILQVPITAATTIEDPSVTDPRERERLFGQHDHVRRYGPDYADRLRSAGFSVVAVEFASRIPAQLARRYGIQPSEIIYFCRKNGEQ